MKYEYLPAFDIQDAHVDGNTFYCNVYSNRVQNGDFQIDQVVEQLKVWVKEEKIQPNEEKFQPNEGKKQPNPKASALGLRAGA